MHETVSSGDRVLMMNMNRPYARGRALDDRTEQLPRKSEFSWYGASGLGVGRSHNMPIPWLASLCCLR